MKYSSAAAFCMKLKKNFFYFPYLKNLAGVDET